MHIILGGFNEPGSQVDSLATTEGILVGWEDGQGGDAEGGQGVGGINQAKGRTIEVVSNIRYGGKRFLSPTVLAVEEAQILGRQEWVRDHETKALGHGIHPG